MDKSGSEPYCDCVSLASRKVQILQRVNRKIHQECARSFSTVEKLRKSSPPNFIYTSATTVYEKA